MDSYALSLHLKPTQGEAWLDERRVWSGPIPANTIRLTPPGVRPRWIGEASFDFLHFLFPRETIDRIAGTDSDRIHRCLRGSAPFYCRDDVAAGLGRSLLEALRRRRPFTLNFVDSIGQALIAHFLGRYAGVSGAHTRSEFNLDTLQRVRAYIAANLQENIRVRNLAAVVDMSESHFAHRFRAATGLSPHRFVTSVRLDRAQVRLACGSSSLLEIAFDCGFKDASHFSRVFKRFLGCTPNAFRRAISDTTGRNKP